VARFDSAIALALRLIQKNGEASIIYRRVDAAPPDATKPWTPGATTETAYPVYAVWVDARIARVPLTEVQAGDQEVLVPASGLTIIPDPVIDRLERADGTSWTIVAVSTLSPNGQVVMHQLHVRQ